MATIMTESLVLTKISVIWLKLSLRRYTGMMFVTIQCLNSEDLKFPSEFWVHLKMKRRL